MVALGWVFVANWWALERVFTRTHDLAVRSYSVTSSAVFWLVPVIVFLAWRSAQGRTGLLGEHKTFAGVVSGATRNLTLITLLFAGMTVLLWDLGAVLPATGATRRSHAWPTTRYYIWNFLDQIPALKVPETLGWRVDRLYTGIAAGLFLLSYKI